MNKKIRTRYAPSPTGFQHIGGVRTALHCYLFAKKNKGSLILRIEDTDQSRYVPGSEEYIIETLKWCGISCDEGPHVGGNYGPYRQSDRKEIYQQYVLKLIDSGNAYYAFDTPDELNAMRERLKASGSSNYAYNAATRHQMRNSFTLSQQEVAKLLADGVPHVVRFKMPSDINIIVNDVVRGAVSVSSNELDDKVLMKGDGMPTYHLANVVDDHLMEISHVIRGEEWLPSTPLHVMLYRAFGWEDTMPQFAHLPLLLKPGGKGKLSKRAADKLGFPVFPLAWEHPLTDESSTGYREIGFLPNAFTNILALLGWHPEGDQEIMNMQQLIDRFSLDRVIKSGAVFDFEKAKWFNQHYIKEMDNKVLAAAVMPFAPNNHKDYNSIYISEVCGLMKERVDTLVDFWKQSWFFFERPQSYDAKIVRKKWKPERVPLFEQLIVEMANLSEFTAEAVEATIKNFMATNNLGFGDVLQVFRVMLAGTKSGPPIFAMAALLGRDEVVSRMEEAALTFADMNG